MTEASHSDLFTVIEISPAVMLIGIPARDADDIATMLHILSIYAPTPRHARAGPWLRRCRGGLPGDDEAPRWSTDAVSCQKSLFPRKR